MYIKTFRHYIYEAYVDHDHEVNMPHRPSDPSLAKRWDERIARTKEWSKKELVKHFEVKQDGFHPKPAMLKKLHDAHKTEVNRHGGPAESEFHDSPSSKTQKPKHEGGHTLHHALVTNTKNGPVYTYAETHGAKTGEIRHHLGPKYEKHLSKPSQHNYDDIKNSINDKISDRRSNGDKKPIKTEKISLDKIRHTQDRVRDESHAKRTINDLDHHGGERMHVFAGHTKHPVGLRLKDGSIHIVDGHHRTQQAFKDGKKDISVHVYDANDEDHKHLQSKLNTKKKD